MRKELVMAASVFFLMSITVITGVSAMDERTVTISNEETDVTGDGISETISLEGIPYEEEEDNYLKEIYFKIDSSNDKNFTIPLESGAKASMQLVDLNHDGIKDLFAHVLTAGSGGTTLNYLFSLKDSIKTELSLPEPLEISSGYENGYKAKLSIAQTGKTYLFDLKDRKKYYKKLGLYYKGKLNEPTELTVNPFKSLKPVSLENGETGLKGVQRISGISNGDTIAYVESSWRYADGKWGLLNTKVRAKKN